MYALAFSPDGKNLASGGGLLWSEVKVWDLASGKLRLTLTSPRSSDAHPDGKLTLPSYRSSGALPAWGFVYSLAFSRHGDLLASGGSDGTIRVWNALTGTLNRSLPPLGSTVWSLAFSPTEDVLASAIGDKTVTLWNPWTGALRECFPTNSKTTSLAFAPDGQTIAIGGNTGSMDLHRVADGHLLATAEGHTLSVWSVSFSADGSMVATGSGDSTVRVWDSPSGHAQRTLGSHYGAVTAVAFAPDGRTLATAGYDGLIRIWDLQTGEPRRAFAGHGTVWSIAFSPDGEHLAAGDDRTIQLWSLGTGSLTRTFAGHSSFVYAVAFSPDGKSLASASQDSTVRLWDVTAGDRPATVERMEGAIHSLAFSPDGTTIACAGEGRTVALWDTATHTIRRRLPDNSGAVYSVAFSPDGQLLATGNGGKTVALWDWRHGTLKRTLRAGHLIVSHASGVRAVAFSSDGRTLASASDDKTVRLWEVQTGRLERTLTGHTESVRAIAFSRDRRRLVSGSDDTTVRVWDPRKGGESLLSLVSFTFTEPDRNAWLIVASNGLFDGTAAAMQRIAWRSHQNGEEVVPLDAFYNDFFYPGLLASIFDGVLPRAPHDLATRFRFPALRTMAQQGLAHVETRDGRVLLCLSTEASPTAMGTLQVFSGGEPVPFGVAGIQQNNHDRRCAYWRELPPNAAPFELVGVTTGWKPRVRPVQRRGRAVTVSAATLHILTVAINDYGGPYKNLRFPVSDGDAVEAFFAAQAHGSQGVYKSMRIWPGLRNQDATRARIVNRLAAMAKDVQPDDVVFLFFSGHGRVPPGQEMFYFIPHIPKSTNRWSVTPFEERVEAVSTAMLAEAIRELPARRVVLVLDACQSGGAVESLAKIGDVKLAAERRRAAHVDRSTAGVFLLAAATPLQDALEPRLAAAESSPEQHGLLTTAILEALRGDASDGVLWIGGVLDRARTNLRRLAKDAKVTQTAFAIEVGADFPVAITGRHTGQ